MNAGLGSFIGGTPKIEHGTGNPQALVYGEMWKREEYRQISPGEQLAQIFIQQARPRPHATAIDFGCGTGRGALMLALLGNMRVVMLDFVNNSLDPEIRDMLTTQAHALKFVKADLEQKIPVAAEYGFCCDVLEHIPSEKVDTVLDNILQAAQHVFFSVSTVPDNMGTLIGEELHLTVQPYHWWLTHFAKRQCIIHWSQDIQDKGVALFYVSAWATGQDIQDSGVLNAEDIQIRENVRHNLTQGWQQVRPHLPNPFEVMILGGGPSLNEYEEQIRAQIKAGVQVATLNGAYNWAIEKDLHLLRVTPTPSAVPLNAGLAGQDPTAVLNQFVVDAREFNARFTKPVLPNARYFLASQCDPSVFEGLPKDRTYLFHTSYELIKDLLNDHYGTGWRLRLPDGTWEQEDGKPVIFKTEGEAVNALTERMGEALEGIEMDGLDVVSFLKPVAPEPYNPGMGGSTVLLRAIPLLRMLGFKKFHLYGCDSCLTAEQHHAYPQPENDGKVLTVTAGGRLFTCQGWMISQAHEFMDLIRSLGDEIELEIYGEGLLKHILDTGAELSEEQATEADAQHAIVRQWLEANFTGEHLMQLLTKLQSAEGDTRSSD